jgi:hypothetical protein
VVRGEYKISTILTFQDDRGEVSDGKLVDQPVRFVFAVATIRVQDVCRRAIALSVYGGCALEGLRKGHSRLNASG